MGLYGGTVLGLSLPQVDKRLYVIVEADGCVADAIVAATNCWPGRRTMRIEDFGKIAATFVDTLSGRAVRIVPRNTARATAARYAPEALCRWDAQLLGYRRMPDDELFEVQEVQLLIPVERLISRSGSRATCDRCGEEIINEREVISEGMTLCRACAGQSYYAFLAVMPAAQPVPAMRTR
jgi:formylmethanofuran dehydrogenase subunit E